MLNKQCYCPVVQNKYYLKKTNKPSRLNDNIFTLTFPLMLAPSACCVDSLEEGV